MLEEFIRKQADGAIFGLGGGIDSAFAPSSETADGILVAESIPVQHKIIQVGPISEAVTRDDTLESTFDKNHTLMKYLSCMGKR